jgi:hypothetical protein
MGESVNCVVLVTFVLVAWSSLAQEDGESWVPIKFPSEDGRQSVPHTAVATPAPRIGESVSRTHGHDRTTSPDDDHAAQGATRDSLQVCKELLL